MTTDPELEAMSAVFTALGRLGDDGRARVLRWAAERYGVITAPPTSRDRDSRPEDEPSPGSQPLVRRASSPSPEPAFDEFIDLFDAIDPRTEMDKALTAAYWLQVNGKQGSWQSLRVNNILKDTGHGLPNVTAALRHAQRHKPALVRQIAKSGKAQQSWKTYKLTTSGVAYLRGKLGLTGTVPADLADQGPDKDT